MAFRCAIMLALSPAVLGVSGLSQGAVVAASPTVTVVEKLRINRYVPGFEQYGNKDSRKGRQ